MRRSGSILVTSGDARHNIGAWLSRKQYVKEWKSISGEYWHFARLLSAGTCDLCCAVLSRLVGQCRAGAHGSRWASCLLSVPCARCCHCAPRRPRLTGGRSVPRPVPSCGEDFTCVTSGQCVDFPRVCDGFPDCSDNSDEANCSTYRELAVALSPIPTPYTPHPTPHSRAFLNPA